MSDPVKALTYIEIDLPYCANTYGTAPCTASIPTTGDAKCFNSKASCQDRVHYVEAGATLRFAVPTEYLPHEIEAIPSVASINYTPAIVSLGTDLGQRATLEITFTDHLDTDTGTGFDKYLADRGYWPYLQGTFFGRFRARHPFLQNVPLRWIQGTLGQDIADMETRHFVIDSFDGPDPTGKFKIKAADVLKLADDDQSQAPVLSNGFLASDITNSATSASLLPSGIGNAEYPSSGYVCIGGNEVVSFTRSADSLTITRAQAGSVASAHKAQDRVQVVLHYSAEDVADIIADLFENYAGVPSSYITIADWEAETAAFLGNVYTTWICEPTGVRSLVSELIEQSALSIWDDNIAQKLRLQVLRGIITDAFTYTPAHYVDGSLSMKDQPEQRLTRVQTYFGQIDPTKPLSNLDNYRSTSLIIDQNAEADYGVIAIKTITSRWIAALGRTVADRLGTIVVGRFRDPPRHLTYDVMRYSDIDPELGIGYQIESPFVQEADGSQAAIPFQVTQLKTMADLITIDAEEMLFDAPPLTPGTHDIIIDADNYNINLRTSHDSIYPAAVSGNTVNVTINTGVVVGSVSTSLPAFDVGSWPSGVIINITVLGRIEGMGGVGGNGAGATSNGLAGGGGGKALYTRYAVNLNNSSGAVWGGGGGGGGGAGGTAQFTSAPNGGGGGGGGGAGRLNGAGGSGGIAGSGASPPTPGASGGSGSDTAGGAGGAHGTTTFGPFPGNGGAGGGPGLAGSAGGAPFGSPLSGSTPGAGGSAGASIDGVSFITHVGGAGDVRGAQIN